MTLLCGVFPTVMPRYGVNRSSISSIREEASVECFLQDLRRQPHEVGTLVVPHCPQMLAAVT
jgi:hypothetical protein